ncbi:hypothetical protein [Microbacterium karelineae]|uniref:hypothetical protein n=1 Tax=Microbacterium karelineae TaxID=2654283 RepID=UPI0012EA14BB|nr:hypothetical protein [Microbacterium karelineae]
MRPLRWLIPLLLVPVTFYGCGALSAWLSRTYEHDGSAAGGWMVAVFIVVYLAMFVLPLTALIVCIVQAVKVHRRWRRSRGRFTKSEQGQIESHRSDATAWNHAAHLRRALIAREVPATIGRPWEIVPYPDEEFFLDAPAQYSRYYGQDVAYDQTSAFVFGHPAFVVGALAVTAISNGAARNAARRQAAEQWREHQAVRVIVTNRRLICVVGGRPLTFDYTAMVAVYPEVAQRTLVCQFDGAEPLMLHGIHVPPMAVLTTMMTLGPDAVARHPSLTVLDLQIDPDRHAVV